MRKSFTHFSTRARLCIRRSLPVIAALYTMSGAHASPAEESPGHQISQITSPAGVLSITAYEPADNRSILYYTVDFGQIRIIQPSPLAMMAAPERWIVGDVVSTTDTTVDEAYRLPVGKNSTARSRYNGTLVVFKERQAPFRLIRVEFRAFDDGVAFRTIVDSPALSDSMMILHEDVDFRFPRASAVHALWLGANTHFEGNYRSWLTLDSVPHNTRFPLPVLLRPSAGVVAAIGEAALLNYPGMSLIMNGDSLPRFVSDLTRRRDDSSVAAIVRGRVVTPWRVIMVAAREVDLIESNILTHLAPPCELPEADWIRPGKTTWDWWNGHLLTSEHDRGKMDFRTMKHYIDFCAANGIEYHSLTGFDEGGGNMMAWYGEHRSFTPSPGTSIRSPIAALQFPSLLDYARAKGVGLRLWLHFAALQQECIDSVFALYEQWGINGFMLDFIERDDQQAIVLLTDILRAAARHHLTVSLHGAAKPTGLTRTFPHLLNHEGVLNLEWDKWSARCTPEHNVTVPFTRMLAGPMDYHLGGVRSVDSAEFTPRYAAPRVMGTRAHNAAMYVVFENYLPMIADFPGAYAGDSVFSLFVNIPSTWDETRAMAGEIGKYIAVARRKDATWYVGIMNGMAPRILDLPLTFLSSGAYRATIICDVDRYVGMGARIETREVTAGSHLTLHLERSGGALIRLMP